MENLFKDIIEIDGIIGIIMINENKSIEYINFIDYIKKKMILNFILRIQLILIL